MWRIHPVNPVTTPAQALRTTPCEKGHSLDLKGFVVTTEQAVNLSVAMIGALAAIIAAYIGRWGNDD
jgi:hypothetical protein